MVLLKKWKRIIFMKTENLDKNLSRREKVCLQLLIEGCQFKHIANKLNIAESTVKSYVSRIRAKIGAKTTTQMIAMICDKKYKEFS